MSLPKIVHPLFDVTIPSTKTKTKLRPMLVKEEKILLIAKQSQHNTDIFNAVYQVVNNCIADPKTKIEKLALFDIEYLYLKLRSFSVNNILTQRYVDSEDDQTYDVKVDLEKVDIVFPKDVEQTIQISDKVSVLMKYPSAQLYADKMVLRDSENLDSTLMLSCIDKIIEGDKMYSVKDADKEEFKEFLENLPIMASNKMKEFVNKLPSFDLDISYKNSKGTERIIKLTSVIDFFIF